ncbi:MAG TPA: EsaB/YukD family protein [Ktedonobacteraceae bacterium]|nr:EsaB/YukD family protein [Ktedonobacteraceae bacterium]
MQTLLVTIIGPRRTIDLEMPGEVPIRELIPIILALCGPTAVSGPHSDPSVWGLGVVDADRPLPSSSSLSAEKLVNGTILQLQELSAWSANRRVHKKAFMPRTITPTPATGGIGVRWSKDGLLNGSG